MATWRGPCPRCGEEIELTYPTADTKIGIPGKSTDPKKKDEKKKGKIGFGGLLAIAIVIGLFIFVIVNNNKNPNRSEIIQSDTKMTAARQWSASKEEDIPVTVTAPIRRQDEVVRTYDNILNGGRKQKVTVMRDANEVEYNVYGEVY